MRCPEKILFGLLLPGAILEFKCRSARCGAKAGIVVLHHFSATTGEFLGTKKYRDPA